METLSLARRLELGPMSPDESMRVMDQIGERVSEWHARGMVHRQLCADRIALGASSDEIDVQEPAPGPVLFGGPHWNLEQSPAEFSAIAPMFVPRNLAEAQAVFATQNLKLDPRQLDVYQLGALFTRLLTGEGVTSYLSSPKTKSRIPENWRSLLDRALGCSREGRLESAVEFVQALRSTEAPTQGDGDTAPANPEAASAHGAIPFTRIGDYEIRSRLGHGGMGDVYQAVDERRNQVVAVKVLPDELARHSDFVRRFYAEAAAAARLQHPHIVEILFVGEDQGRHFFVMEYVAGESLAERLARQRCLPVGEALDITRQVLSALSVAHAEGMVHRDIKPGNILLDTARNRAVLADFGLVKSLQETTGLTATGVVVGSVQYLSPEQARGRPVDARSDLYSLGVLLYQMLSGELPFTGEGATALIFQHVYEPSRPLIEAAPTVSPVLGVIVDKLLAKVPALRYATAELVAADLQAFVNQQPLPSDADIIEDEDEHGLVADLHQPLDGSVLIAAPQFDRVPVISMLDEPTEQQRAAGGTTWWQSLWRKARDRAPAFARSLQSTGQQVDGAVAEYERRQRTLQHFTRRALQLLQELRRQRAEWQSAAERTKDSEEQVRCQHSIEELSHQIAEQQAHLSAMRLQQARILATLERLRSQRDLLRARLKVAEASVRLAGWKRRRRAGVSLASSIVCLCVGASVWIVLDGSKVRRSTTAIVAPEKVVEIGPMPLAIPENTFEPASQKLAGPAVSIGPMDFSEDGSKLYVGGADGRPVAWNLETGKPLQEKAIETDPSADPLRGLAVVPGVNGLISWKSSQATIEVQLWPFAIDSSPQTFRIKKRILNRLVPTSELKRSFLISQQLGRRERSLDLYDLEADAPLQHIADNVRNAVYCAAESLLVYRSQDGRLHLWSLKSRTDLKTCDGGSLPSPDGYEALAVNSTGTLAAVNDVAYNRAGVRVQSVQVFDLDTGRKQLEFALRGAPVRVLAFQPGTDMLAVATGDEIELWDLALQRVRKRFSASEVWRIAFSPDGRTLAGSGTTNQKPYTFLWDAVPSPLVTTGAARLSKGFGPATLSADGTRYAQVERAQANVRANVAPEGEGADFILRLAQDSRELLRIPVRGNARTIFLSPDDRFAAISLGKPRSRCDILDLERKTVRKTFPGDAIGFGSDSTLYFGEQSDLKKCDVETGQISTVKEGILENAAQRAMSPRRNWIAVLRSGGELVLTNIENPEDSRRLAVGGSMTGLCFSPDGSNVAVGSPTEVAIWERETGRLVRKFPAPASHLVYSPDGSKLATSQNGVAVRSAQTGDQLLDFVITGKWRSRAEFLSFTPDGRYLLCSSPLRQSMLLDCTVYEAPKK